MTFECARIFDPETYNHGNECKMDAQSVKMTPYLTVKLCKCLNEKYTAPSKYCTVNVINYCTVKNGVQCKIW